MAIALIIVGCSSNSGTSARSEPDGSAVPASTTAAPPAGTAGPTVGSASTTSSQTASAPSTTVSSAATVSCPNPDGGRSNVCLGPIQAGTYTTKNFEPTLTYTVPEGWANLEDLPGNFLLLPPGSTLDGVNTGMSDYIGVYTSVAPPGHCDGKPSTAVPHTFDGLVTFLTTNNAIAVTNRHDVTLGGLTGVAMDLAMTGTTGDGCADGAYADMYVGLSPSSLVHAVIPQAPNRIYLLRNGTDVLLVEMSDATPGGSDIIDWYTAASQVASSFHFTTQ